MVFYVHPFATEMNCHPVYFDGQVPAFLQPRTRPCHRHRRHPGFNPQAAWPVALDVLEQVAQAFNDGQKESEKVVKPTEAPKEATKETPKETPKEAPRTLNQLMNSIMETMMQSQLDQGNLDQKETKTCEKEPEKAQKANENKATTSDEQKSEPTKEAPKMEAPKTLNQLMNCIMEAMMQPELEQDIADQKEAEKKTVEKAQNDHEEKNPVANEVSLEEKSKAKNETRFATKVAAHEDLEKVEICIEFFGHKFLPESLDVQIIGEEFIVVKAEEGDKKFERRFKLPKKALLNKVESIFKNKDKQSLLIRIPKDVPIKQIPISMED